jgi:hypothetical protein
LNRCCFPGLGAEFADSGQKLRKSRRKNEKVAVKFAAAGKEEQAAKLRSEDKKRFEFRVSSFELSSQAHENRQSAFGNQLNQQQLELPAEQLRASFGAVEFESIIPLTCLCDLQKRLGDIAPLEMNRAASSLVMATSGNSGQRL